MKLHRIAVCNLNSLYDEQTVDLEGGLEGASLFLIQGPTGSGKSTLMDAVSLALFGTTPRLGAIKGGKNIASEILSHGTAEGFAEVVFSRWHSGDAGAPLAGRVMYRARWMARRARSRPDGNMQDTKRSLERLRPGFAQDAPDGWDLLVSDARDKVIQPVFDEHLEGFGLHDFQRSMLLAQGQFDAMLSAKPEERATILERLTNTDIYEKLGQRAAEIRGQLARRLELLEAEVGRLSGDGEQESYEVLERRSAAAREALAAHQGRRQAVERVLEIEGQLGRLAAEAEQDEAALPPARAGLEQARADAERARGARDAIETATLELQAPLRAVRQRLQARDQARTNHERASQALATARQQVEGRREAIRALTEALEQAGGEARATWIELGLELGLDPGLDPGLEPGLDPHPDAANWLDEAPRVRAVLRGQADELDRDDRRLEHQQALLRDGVPLQRRATEAEAAQIELERTLGDARQRHEVRQAELIAAEKRLEAARATRAPIERLLHHREERARLAAGEPCPLCGSTEHPLRDQHDDEALAEVDRTSAQELEAAQRAHTQARDQGQRLIAQIEQLEARRPMVRADLEQAHAELAAHQTALRETFGDEVPEREALAGERARARDLNSRLRHLDRAIGSLETEATRLATARTELDREITVVRSAEQDEAQAEVAHGEARNDLVRAWDELAGAWAAAAQLDEPSDGSAHGGGVPGDPASRTPPRPALPDAADLADLQATRLDALEQHQAELGRRARAWAEQIERGEVKARSRVEALENRLTVRAETRSRLEAERIPAAEDLDRQLMASGIEVERTRETLMRLRDELQAEEPELDRARVAAEGALESARQRARDLADAVRRRDEARRRSEVWLQLHDLIGKGEGKRFKEFAQALNLGQLLERANRHLARLNERYRLIPVHDDETGLPTLEFELADGWRPGSTRSIRTLSGGESFLVSLALALGLSDLRTSSMPIETLLLDEGFGTLDRETLDVALAALQQLQADGRQIGIISHVAGLEDRIDARIHVEPLGNGRSRVRVGVER